MSKFELMSMRAYARHRKGLGLPGQSHTAVRKAIDSGRIVDAVSEGPKGQMLIDADLADRFWIENTDLSQSRDPEAVRGGRPRDGDLYGDSLEEPQTTEQRKRMAASIKRANEVQAVYQARLVRLRFQRESSELVEKAAVEVEAFKVWRGVRDALLKIPDRVAPMVAAEKTVKRREKTCRDLMHQEIVKVLEGLSRTPGVEGLE